MSAGPDAAGAAPAPAPAPPGRLVGEVLLLFALATAIAAAVFQVGRFVPLVGKHVADLIAVTFYAVPVIALWRRGRDLDEYGFNLKNWRRGGLLVVAAMMVVFPAFLVAFLAFYGAVCGPLQHALGVVAAPGLCARFHGLAGAHPAWPGGTAWATLVAAFTQVVAVGLPEEFFFRGYLQGRLEEALPARRRFLGVPVGQALLLASVLFALGHYLIDFDPRRLAVFFPALAFGWMRTASGSIVPGAIFHALCNLLSDGLHRTFFG
ncbi:MAG TPA: CPBP family intramembrane glutamic endopeptidase [Polyangia bacterium]